ncbi:ABC transporter substrate-binding protein [Halomonas campisalis]|uniref:ABC transporter substrate-binding protein n=1 Tax=Billgrantia campisalis TaxID=74661 RepID=A0ABS9P7L7_9GAMM|nr:ABC transporter substrate-binding protein [Halomonas campisalis]MCG6657770.1 ABC transporter substrate-binding protein [Halomonas campisalis]MDR5862458.1 ABC transporter substrate-binding protein [Halomonas campisalis]
MIFSPPCPAVAAAASPSWWHRRVLLALLLALALVPAPRALAQPAIATLDWTLAETLVALGVTPVGVAQIDAYHAWVGAPRLPETTVDLGLRSQPNLELLASLAPDRLLISPMFANLAPRLSRIAPVANLPLYSPGRETWRQLHELTREVGRLAEREADAERLVIETEAWLAALRQRLPPRVPPLLVVQFMDERHVRVFGEGGLYQAVMARLGLENAWHGETNAWGFSLVGLEQLVGLEAQLVVVEPYPVGVEAALAGSGLWQRQPSVRQDALITLPPVWSFGALPSARRFADHLVTALEEASHED